MMKKHKNKANGFLMFMLEYKREHQVDINEAQLKAGLIWERMNSEQRSKYSTQSNASNFEREEPQKLTSFGVSINEIEKQKLQELRRIRNVDIMIEDMLQSVDGQAGLHSLSVFFFSASHFVQTLTGDIFPAEIAMAKFSLAKGVHETFHMMVNPGKLPLGKAAEAKEYAEATHKRELPPNTEGETEYPEVFKRMLQFMEVEWTDRRNRLPPLFIECGLKNADYKTAQLTLEKILQESEINNVEFRLFPLENFLYKLQKKCFESRSVNAPQLYPKKFTSVLEAKDMIRRDSFMYNDVGCTFHYEKDASAHCCLAKVKRWGYEISKLCMNDNELIPGYHFPISSTPNDDEVASTQARDSDWETDTTESLKNLRIGSRISLKNIQGTSKETEISSFSESYVKSDSFTTAEEESLPSTEDTPAKVPLVGIGSVMSFTQSFSTIGRGSKKSGSTRGAKRQ